MRNEFRIILWAKIIYIINSLIGLLGVAFVVQSYFLSHFELLISGIFFTVYGLIFLRTTISRLKWPVFVLEDNNLICRGIFGKIKEYSNLEQYEVELTNTGVTVLHDSDGKKYYLSSNLIGKKKTNQLYVEIKKYATPLM